MDKLFSPDEEICGFNCDMKLNDVYESHRNWSWNLVDAFLHWEGEWLTNEPTAWNKAPGFSRNSWFCNYVMTSHWYPNMKHFRRSRETLIFLFISAFLYFLFESFAWSVVSGKGLHFGNCILMRSIKSSRDQHIWLELSCKSLTDKPFNQCYFGTGQLRADTCPWTVSRKWKPDMIRDNKTKLLNIRENPDKNDSEEQSVFTLGSLQTWFLNQF